MPAAGAGERDTEHCRVALAAVQRFVVPAVLPHSGLDRLASADAAMAYTRAQSVTSTRGIIGQVTSSSAGSEEGKR